VKAMVVKVYVIEGTIDASSSEKKIGEAPVPGGHKWKLIELRPYTDASSGVKMWVKKGTDAYYELTAEALNTYKLPYPGDMELSEGDRIVLSASNSNASSQVVKLEIIVDESAR